MNRLFLLMIFCFSLNLRKAEEFHYYVFTSVWIGTICTFHECSHAKGANPKFWNIHGLWPSNNRDGPNYCSDTRFDPHVLADLDGYLTEYWNGLFSKAKYFHAHEWVKHGTCSNMKEVNYFSTAIGLGLGMNLYHTLEENNIVPGKTYQCSEIAEVLQQSYGVNKISIRAIQGHLSDISFCFDKELNLQDCPDKAKVCKGTVLYPEYDSKLFEDLSSTVCVENFNLSIRRGIVFDSFPRYVSYFDNFVSRNWILLYFFLKQTKLKST